MGKGGWGRRGWVEYEGRERKREKARVREREESG
jgi:hypothetical protein